MFLVPDGEWVMSVEMKVENSLWTDSAIIEAMISGGFLQVDWPGLTAKSSCTLIYTSRRYSQRVNPFISRSFGSRYTEDGAMNFSSGIQLKQTTSTSDSS